VALKVDNRIFRIIDANLNRLKEGLRVCEDIARFIINDSSLTEGYKKIRHRASQLLNESSVNFKKIIHSRDIVSDVGRRSHRLELRRKDVLSIFFANTQRAKESMRVIEEFNKLINKDLARKFKNLRYKLYELEKKAIKKIETLYCSR
jgi:thiamine-phosphate pyrophosphorylase